MRKWFIRNMKYSWDSKIFGTTHRHLRAVNVLVPLFVIAGLVNVFTEGLPWIDIVVFIPFVLGFFFPFFHPEFDELDWEQQVQYVNKHDYKHDGEPITDEEKRLLAARWNKKYKFSKSKFVEAWRFFSPIVWITVAFIIYGIFGSAEEGFWELRFF